MTGPRAEGGARVWDGPSVAADLSPPAAGRTKALVVHVGAHAVAGLEIPYVPEPFAEDGAKAARLEAYTAHRDRMLGDLLRMLQGLNTPQVTHPEGRELPPHVVTYDLRTFTRGGGDGVGLGRLHFLLLVKAFVASNSRDAPPAKAAADAVRQAVTARWLCRAVAPRELTLLPLAWDATAGWVREADRRVVAASDAEAGLTAGLYPEYGELRRVNYPTGPAADLDHRRLGEQLVTGQLHTAPRPWPVRPHGLTVTAGFMTSAPGPLLLSVRLQPALLTPRERAAVAARLAALGPPGKATAAARAAGLTARLRTGGGLFWSAVQVAGPDPDTVRRFLTTLGGEQAVGEASAQASRANDKTGRRQAVARRRPARVSCLHAHERAAAGFNLTAVELLPWGGVSSAVQQEANPVAAIQSNPPTVTAVDDRDPALRPPDVFLDRDLECDPALARGRQLLTQVEAAAVWRLPVVEPGGLAGVPSRLFNPFEFIPVSPVPAPAPLAVNLGEVQHRGVGTGVAYRVPLLKMPGLAGAGDKVMVVAGSPGSGKTNFCLGLLAQLWAKDWPAAKRVPFLVVDPTCGREFRALDPATNGELVTFTVGDSRCVPFCFNPFIVPARVSVQAHVTRLMSCFRAAYHLWDPLPAIFEEGIRLAYQRHFDFLQEIGRPVASREFGTGRLADYPTLADLCAAMGTGKDGEGDTVMARMVELWGKGTENQATIVASVTLRLDNLRRNYEGVIGGPGPGRPCVDLVKLLKRPVVMEFGMVGDSQAMALLMAFLVVSLAGCIETRKITEDTLHLLVLEEAHRLLAGESHGGGAEAGNARVQAAEDINNMLAEVRKYRQGVILLDQRPGSLVGGCIDNAYLVALHRLNERKSFDQFCELLNLGPEQRRFARIGLQAGEAVVLDKATGMPFLLKPANQGTDTAKENKTDEELDAALAAAVAPRLAGLYFDPTRGAGAERVHEMAATGGTVGTHLAAARQALEAAARKPDETAHLGAARVAIGKVGKAVGLPANWDDTRTELLFELANEAGLPKPLMRELLTS